MSRTVGISYNGRFFWAYDVALSVLLKFMIDTVEQLNLLAHSSWMAELLSGWRYTAVIGGSGSSMTIGDWPPEKMSDFVDVVQSSCRELRKRQVILASEVQSWQLLDDMQVSTRGAVEVRTAAVVELGEAIVGLIEGSLPPAPEDTWWYFGLDGGPSTIAMRVSERPRDTKA